MDFPSFPVFGLWMRFRLLATHRIELPFTSNDALLAVLGSLPGGTRRRYGRLHDAFKYLTADCSPERPCEPAILTMCWGDLHAARLALWLRVVRRAGLSNGPLVLCFDVVSLESCRTAHDKPRLCADAREWPASSLSKLSAISLALSHGLDVLWVDTDAVVLRNPVPFLKPILLDPDPVGADLTIVDAGSDRRSERRPPPDLLFSVEADSWNCVNSGVFLVRATRAALHFMGFWLSLLLERPVSSDQFTLYLLLGLMPGMNYRLFAQREGLLSAVAPRVRALGSLQTPTWGALDPRVHFTATAEVRYGGIERDLASDVVIFHMLDGWPEDMIPNPLFWDLRQEGKDPVGYVLQEVLLHEGPGPLLHRHHRSGWVPHPEGLGPGGRRSCQQTYHHGR